MSKIDELIQQYCPDGVEFDTLGNLGVFYGGITGKSKADFTNGNAKFISYMNVYSNPSVDQNTEDAVKIGKDEKQRTLQYCDVCFTGSSETPDECGFASVVTEHPTESLYLNSFCFFFRFNEPERFNPHFLKHLFRDHDLRYQIGKTANGVTRFNVSKELMKSVEIPVPPLPVQEEIVRILDTYTEFETELETKLETEIKFRHSQLEFYLDKMLSFDNSVDFVPMSELFDFRNGLSKGKDFFGKGIRFIRYSDVYNNRCLNSKDVTALVDCNLQEINKLQVKRGDVFFTRTSETREDVGISSVLLEDLGECVFNGFTIKATPKTDRLLPEYCKYCFSDKRFRKYVADNCVFTTRASLTGKTIGNYELPIPSLEKQRHIVDVLDKYVLFNHSIFETIPDEIKLRHQQYEYYRDKLLTFKKLEVV